VSTKYRKGQRVKYKIGRGRGTVLEVAGEQIKVQTADGFHLRRQASNVLPSTRTRTRRPGPRLGLIARRQEREDARRLCVRLVLPRLSGMPVIE
jgi:hypothetical protein